MSYNMYLIPENYHNSILNCFFYIYNNGVKIKNIKYHNKYHN